MGKGAKWTIALFFQHHLDASINYHLHNGAWDHIFHQKCQPPGSWMHHEYSSAPGKCVAHRYWRPISLTRSQLVAHQRQAPINFCPQAASAEHCDLHIPCRLIKTWWWGTINELLGSRKNGWVYWAGSEAVAWGKNSIQLFFPAFLWKNRAFLSTKMSQNFRFRSQSFEYKNYCFQSIVWTKYTK